MAKTAEMRLRELMIMKQDVDPVIEYLGKKGVFQFYSQLKESSSNVPNTSKEVFDKLQLIRAYLNINDIDDYNCNPSKPSDADFREASEIIRNTDEIREKAEQLFGDAALRHDDAAQDEQRHRQDRSGVRAGERVVDHLREGTAF